MYTYIISKSFCQSFKFVLLWPFPEKLQFISQQCLEPPRVRFANRVEENVILKTSFRSKKVLKQGKEKGQREMKTK